MLNFLLTTKHIGIVLTFFQIKVKAHMLPMVFVTLMVLRYAVTRPHCHQVLKPLPRISLLLVDLIIPLACFPQFYNPGPRTYQLTGSVSLFGFSIHQRWVRPSGICPFPSELFYLTWHPPVPPKSQKLWDSIFAYSCKGFPCKYTMTSLPTICYQILGCLQNPD